jgi:hypothetical protein
MAERPAGCGVEMIEDQPAPVPNDKPAVWSLVIEDMQARDALGRERYGTPLQPFNGRDALVDAYQEALDLVVYLRQAIAERDEQDENRRRAYEDLAGQLRAALAESSRWDRFVMSRWFVVSCVLAAGAAMLALAAIINSLGS